MSKTNVFEQQTLEHVFQNANIALVGDTTGLQGSTGDGFLYVSLHQSDPGESADQTTGECDYTSYARVPVARTTDGWTLSANVISNAAAITFAKSTGGANTVRFFGIGTTISGAGKMLYYGGTNSSLSVIADQTTPEFAAGSLTVTSL